MVQISDKAGRNKVEDDLIRNHSLKSSFDRCARKVGDHVTDEVYMTKQLNWTVVASNDSHN